MKKIITYSLLFFWIVAAQAQFSSNEVLEKQFENSALYFQRFYLNTFGLTNFTRVAPGFFDDPFLRISLNPASGALDSLKKIEFYFDYRSERQNNVPDRLIRPTPIYVYGDYIAIYPPDPRWYRVTRSEPEPVLSAGFRAQLASAWQLTLAYQLIYKEEPFYRQPVYLYQPNPYYDGFNQRIFPEQMDVPITRLNRQGDQSLTRAHLFAAYISYRLSRSIAVGIGADFAAHRRNADYLALKRNDYENSYFSQYINKRDMDYHHADFFAGMSWQINERWRVGWQAGLLDGGVKQREFLDDTLQSKDQYGSYDYRQLEKTRLQHDGQRYYATLSIQFSPNKWNKVFGFFNFASLNNDIATFAEIRTHRQSDYYSENGLEYYLMNGISTLTDSRNGRGDLSEHLFESMITVMLNQNATTRMHLGLYFSYLKGKKSVQEPVFYEAYSHRVEEGERPITGYYSYESTYHTREDKTLYWTYDYTRQTIQMPIYWWHRMHKNLAIFLIINKIWTAWETSEKTDAYYRERYDLHDGEENVRKDFIERTQIQPGRHFTEDTADMALGFEAPLVKNTTVRYLINPDFVEDITITQWWLSITMRF